MTSAQKIIKYLAIAFALFLTVTIISAIVGAGYGIFSAIGLINSEEHKVLENLVTVSDNAEEITSLKLEIKGSDVQIVKSEKFEVKTNNSDIKYHNENGNIVIKEDRPDKWFFGESFDGSMIIYLPENMEQMEKVDIEVGAGKIKIERLDTKELKLELGAGEVVIDNLKVSKKANVHGGVGATIIKSGEIANANFELGVGETNITAEITGNSKVDTGVGALRLNLISEQENYKFDIDKGLGAIKLNGKNLADDITVGNGDNYIKVDGGIGEVNITTK